MCVCVSVQAVQFPVVATFSGDRDRTLAVSLTSRASPLVRVSVSSNTHTHTHTHTAPLSLSPLGLRDSARFCQDESVTLGVELIENLHIYSILVPIITRRNGTK